MAHTPPLPSLMLTCLKCGQPCVCTCTARVAQRPLRGIRVIMRWVSGQRVPEGAHRNPGREGEDSLLAPSGLLRMQRTAWGAHTSRENLGRRGGVSPSHPASMSLTRRLRPSRASMPAFTPSCVPFSPPVTRRESSPAAAARSAELCASACPSCSWSTGHTHAVHRRSNRTAPAQGALSQVQVVAARLKVAVYCLADWHGAAWPASSPPSTTLMLHTQASLREQRFPASASSKKTLSPYPHRRSNP